MIPDGLSANSDSDSDAAAVTVASVTVLIMMHLVVNLVRFMRPPRVPGGASLDKASTVASRQIETAR